MYPDHVYDRLGSRARLYLRPISPTKPCEACLYYALGNDGRGTPYCGHPMRTSIFHNRTERGSCGVGGSLYEART